MVKYSQEFFDHHASGSTKSATRLVPIVRNLVKPKSVLDIGCGNGGWLKAWQRAGVRDVVGVDGDYVDRDKLYIAKNKFVAHDLTTPLDLKRKFDLVMTLEVGEHLDRKYAKTFVKSLVNHGDVVFFSAALPGQGGTHHVNEQWPSYWAKLFAVHGYECFNVLRPLIWEDTAIEVWYRQNCMIFASPKAAKRLRLRRNDVPLDMVHPELFAHQSHTLHIEVDRLTKELAHAGSSKDRRIGKAKRRVGSALRRAKRIVR
jgi:SAM-dependent methyltransferase